MTAMTRWSQPVSGWLWRAAVCAQQQQHVLLNHFRSIGSSSSVAAAAHALAPDAPVRAAIVRGLPSSFAAASLRHDPSQRISMPEARRQHDAYVAALRGSLGLRVVEVEADDAHPDCCFVEDAAVVVAGAGVAVVTRPGAEARRGEVGPVEAALRRLAAERPQQGQQAPLIRELHRIEAPGLLDGGDVLQISDHLVVGLSSRTNASAVDQLRRILGGVPGAPRAVEAVEVPRGLHLKSACSALDASTLLISDDDAGAAIAERLRARLPGLARRLSFEVVPGDGLAANVLRANSAVVMQRPPPEAPEAEARLRELCGRRELRLVVLEPRMSEFIKADGAMTCCSILL